MKSSMLKEIALDKAQSYMPCALKGKLKNFNDSLKYSKLLQENMMPSEERVKKIFPDSFVYFQPFELIGGDFYTVHEDKEYKYFILGDCSGHGVRGAMLATLSLGVLNTILASGNTDCSEILQSLDQQLLIALNSSGNASMNQGICELAIIQLNKKNNFLSFASANHKAILIFKGIPIVLSGSKYPIAGAIFQDHRSFPYQRIKLSKGDAIYLFSDGFQDQFGGSNDKKFSSKRFYQLICESASLPFENQKKLIEAQLLEWKNGSPLNDDISIAGIRV